MSIITMSRNETGKCLKFTRFTICMMPCSLLKTEEPLQPRSERVTIQPGWLSGAMMQPFNRIDVVVSQSVTATGEYALTEHMLPCSCVSDYDSTRFGEGFDQSDLPSDGMDAVQCEAVMEISGAGFVGGAGGIRPVQFTGVPSAAPGVDPLNAPQDEVFISPAARLLQNQDVGAAHGRNVWPKSVLRFLRVFTTHPKNWPWLSTVSFRT